MYRNSLFYKNVFSTPLPRNNLYLILILISRTMILCNIHIPIDNILQLFKLNNIIHHFPLLGLKIIILFLILFMYLYNYKPQLACNKIMVSLKYRFILFLDVDECYENPKICLNGKCRNTPGSYICECQPGYTVSPDGTFCTDINECEKRPGLCSNGKCANTEGSYKCVCDSGYRLTPDRQNCIGISIINKHLKAIVYVF